MTRALNMGRVEHTDTTAHVGTGGDPVGGVATDGCLPGDEGDAELHCSGAESSTTRVKSAMSAWAYVLMKGNSSSCR